MRNPNPSYPTHRAFTLIELLVVIAIIALLVSILMPSLSRAKSLARAAASLANIRSIGTWAAMKSEDNGGYVVYNGQSDPPEHSWYHFYQGFEEETLWYEQIAEDMGFEIVGGSNSVLKDPQYKRSRAMTTAELGDTESVLKGVHVDYALNAYMGGWANTWLPQKPRPLTSLTAQVYLFAPGGKRLDAATWGVADGFTASYSENNSVGQFAWPWTWKPTTPAGVRSPYLFGDYHAEFVTWEERDAMSDGEYERFYHNL